MKTRLLNQLRWIAFAYAFANEVVFQAQIIVRRCHVFIEVDRWRPIESAVILRLGCMYPFDYTHLFSNLRIAIYGLSNAPCDLPVLSQGVFGVLSFSRKI